jgi:hypothetical protein
MSNLNHPNTSAVTFMDNWTIRAKQLREKFPSLTDADLKYEVGRENEILSSIASRLHTTREEVIRLIRECQPSN